tara:strand:+ start:4456 stop:4728 length:273 start_codon:yes stop_codon:yes gene_type:complete
MIERGIADGSGWVDMGDDLHGATREYETVRLPDEHGGQWVAVYDREVVRLPDGRIGILNILAHKTLNVIEMRDGSGFLWVRKREAEGEEE